MPKTTPKTTPRTLRTLALPLMSLGLLSLLMAGCHRNGHRRPDMDLVNMIVTYKLDEVLDEIDATRLQRDEFHAAKDWMLSMVEDGMRARRADRQVFLSEIKADAPDAARLHALLDQRIEEKRQLAHDILDTILDLHAILTPGQRDRLFQLVEERMKNGPIKFFGGRDHNAPSPGRRFKKKIHGLLH